MAKAKSHETICSCNECESLNCFGLNKISELKCTCPNCENMNTTCLYYKKLREDPSNLTALRKLLNEIVQRLPQPSSKPVPEKLTDGIEEPPPSSVPLLEYVSNAIKSTLSLTTMGQTISKVKQIASTTEIPVVKEQDPKDTETILCNICNQNRDECPCFYYDNKVTSLLEDLHRYMYSVKKKGNEDPSHPSCGHPCAHPCKIQNRMYDPEIREIVKKYLIKQIEKAKNCCKSEDRPTHVEIHPKTIDLITKQICSFKSSEGSTCGSKKCSFHDLKPQMEKDKCQKSIAQNEITGQIGGPTSKKQTPSRCKMEAILNQSKTPNENEFKNKAQSSSSGRECNDCCQSEAKSKHNTTCPVYKEAHNSSNLKYQEEPKSWCSREPIVDVKRSKYVKDGVLTEIVKTERAYKIINGKKIPEKKGNVNNNEKDKDKDKEYIIQTCGLITAPERANNPYGPFYKTVSCSNVFTNQDSGLYFNQYEPQTEFNSKQSIFGMCRNELCDCDPCESEFCCKTKTSKDLLHEFFGSEINGFFNKPLLWQPKSVPQCNKPCECNASKSMTKHNYIIGRVEQDPHCHCSACHCMDCTQSTPLSGNARTPEIRSNRETQEMSTSFHSNRHANCYCDSCNNRLCEQEGNDTCSCGRQKDGVMRKPVTKDTNEYDIRHAIINETNQNSWFQNSNKQQGTIAMYASLPNSAVKMEHHDNCYDDLIDDAAFRISTIEYLLGLNKTPCQMQTLANVNPCNCKPCDCMQCQRHYRERHIPEMNVLDGSCEICECINSNKKKYLCDPKTACNCMPCDCAECKKFVDYRDYMKYTHEEDAVTKPIFFHKEQVHNQPCKIDFHATDSEIYIDYLLRKLNDNFKEQTAETKHKLQEYGNICYEVRHNSNTETKNTNTALKTPVKALGTGTSMITMSVNQSNSVPQLTPKTIFRDNFCNSSGHDYYEYINQTPRYQLYNSSINKYKASNVSAANNYVCDDVPVLKKKSIEQVSLKQDANKILNSSKCCAANPNQRECDYQPSKCNECYIGSQYNKCRCDCITCDCSSVNQSSLTKKTEPTQTLLSHQNRGENTIDHLSPAYSVERNRIIYDYFNPTEDLNRKDRKLYDRPDEFDIKIPSDLKDTNSSSVERTLEQSKELSRELMKMLEKYKQANKDFDSITSKYNCQTTAEKEKNEIANDNGCIRDIKEHQNMLGQKDEAKKKETVNTAEVIVKIETACDHLESKHESNNLIYDLSSRSSKLLELKKKFKKFSADLDMAIGNCERNRWRKINDSNIFTPPKPTSATKEEKKWSTSELNTVFTCATKDPRYNESPVKKNKSSKQQENCDEDESMTNLIEETSLLLEKSKNSLKKLRANYVAKSGVTSEQPNLPLCPSKGYQNNMMSGKRIQKSFNYDDSLEEMYKRKFVSLPAMNLRTWIHEKKDSPQILTFKSVSKLSDHSIMVKWHTPKYLTNIIGYELLIDERPVQKILSPNRRIAIITCLPHSDKIRLTLRSILAKTNTNNNYLDNQGYHPVDGPSATYMYYPKPYNKYRRSRSNFLHKNCGLYKDTDDLGEEAKVDQLDLPKSSKMHQSVLSHVSGQPSQQLSNQLSHQYSHQLSHQQSNQLSRQYSRQLSRPSYHSQSHLSHRSRSHHSDMSHSQSKIYSQHNI